jgi:hypothetical protein
VIIIRRLWNDVIDAGALLVGAVLESFADLKTSERVARVLFLAIVVGCAVAVLAGCRPPVNTNPGSPVEIDPATVSAPIVATAVVPSAVIPRG